MQQTSKQMKQLNPRPHTSLSPFCSGIVGRTSLLLLYLVFLQGEEWQPPPPAIFLSDVEACREEEQVEERACRLGLSSERLFFKVKVLMIWCLRF